LTPGQASVERGFSANKQTEADNGTGDIFEAKRLVFDHILLVGGICNIDISNKQLLLAWQKSYSMSRKNEHLYILH